MYKTYISRLDVSNAHFRLLFLYDPMHLSVTRPLLPEMFVEYVLGTQYTHTALTRLYSDDYLMGRVEVTFAGCQCLRQRRCVRSGNTVPSIFVSDSNSTQWNSVFVFWETSQRVYIYVCVSLQGADPAATATTADPCDCLSE